MAKMTFRTDDHKPEEGLWFTFNEWKEKGFGVIKGEKARRYVRGIAVFHESQVSSIDTDDYYDELRGIGCGWDWWKD